MMEYAASYKLALLSLTLLAFMIPMQGFVAIFLKSVKGDTPPGQTPLGDHRDRKVRAERAHLNSVENFSPFAAALIVAILAGAMPWLVNLLAATYVISRMAHWVIYFNAIGKHEGGPRTLVFILGWGISLGLAVLAFATVLTS